MIVLSILTIIAGRFAWLVACTAIPADVIFKALYNAAKLSLMTLNSDDARAFIDKALHSDVLKIRTKVKSDVIITPFLILKACLFTIV